MPSIDLSLTCTDCTCVVINEKRANALSSTLSTGLSFGEAQSPTAHFIQPRPSKHHSSTSEIVHAVPDFTSALIDRFMFQAAVFGYIKMIDQPSWPFDMEIPSARFSRCTRHHFLLWLNTSPQDFYMGFFICVCLGRTGKTKISPATSSYLRRRPIGICPLPSSCDHEALRGTHLAKLTAAFTELVNMRWTPIWIYG
jgi:hypothetical protein